jgi:phosphomannomutase/phosphoglucomutase
MVKEKIFREYDIRGIVGQELTEETAFLLGKAFGTFLKSQNAAAKSVSVGRDIRLSSDALSLNLINGIIYTGINVYDIGVCPTPVQYFSIHNLDLDGGIMITGSHNPSEYNGFKVSIGKETIFGKDIQKLKEIIEKEGWISAEKKGEIKKYDIVGAYKDFLLKQFSYLSSSKYKRVKVVIDAGNGTAGIIAPEILSHIGCEVIPLFCEPDGNFPNHHPDPTVVENLQDLISEVKRTKADVGVAYDGDSDRIGIVDSSGDIVWGDQLMIILSRDLLKKHPGAKIIGDVKCSQIMFDDIKKNGGIPIMWKTGHSLVKQKMREENALIAGEFSGHIFIKDRYFGFDDAIYATLRLIEIMKINSMNVIELLSGIPKMSYTPEIRIECPDEKKKQVINNVVARFLDYSKKDSGLYNIKDIYVTDGIRVVFDKGWGLIRSSNTQPVIVMRVEAENDIFLNKYKSFLESEFLKAMEVL